MPVVRGNEIGLKVLCQLEKVQLIDGCCLNAEWKAERKTENLLKRYTLCNF